MSTRKLQRIGIVCPYSMSVPGGVQGQVLGLAHSLLKRGYSVRVLAPCDGPPTEAFVTPLGSTVPFSANGSIAPIAPDYPAVRRTVQALTDEDFDVVHVHEPLVPGACVTSVLYSEAPVVATFHRAGGPRVYEALSPFLKGALKKRLAAWVAVSKDAAATAAPLGGDFELLFNGVEIERFSTASLIDTEPGRKAVFFLGRHEPRKGLRLLLEALSSLPPNVDLWIAGSGPQTEQLKREFTDSRITWLGRVSDAEVASRLRSADAFCIPSLGGESFGVVLLEGMAAETVVVASDIDGYRNVATGGDNAIMVQPDDVAALSRGLNLALSDDSLRAQLIRNGVTRAKQFGMDELAERYVEIYERVLALPPRPTFKDRRSRFMSWIARHPRYG